MGYEKVLGERKFPTYEQLKSGLLRLIDEGKISREDASRLLPELRESEDEMIRRTLVEYFGPEAQIDLIRGIPIQKIRDWLEKQKEQKQTDLPAGFYYVDPNGNRYYSKEFRYGDMKLKVGEREPAEWSEDYREEDIQTRFAFYTYKDDPSVLYLSNVFVEETSRNHGLGTRILKAAEKAAEAIGAIKICLKVKQSSPANAWYRKRGYGYVAFEHGYDWLEKNLEYLKPTQPAEWSEEDEKMLADTIFKLAGFMGNEKNLAWLKSLRSRSSWKPSEEQMNALVSARFLYRDRLENFETASALESLCVDLNKLRYGSTK